MEPASETIRKTDELIRSFRLINNWGILSWLDNEKRPMCHKDVRNLICSLHQLLGHMMPIASPYKLDGPKADEAVDRFIEYIHAISFGYIDVEPLKNLNDMFNVQVANKYEYYIMSDELPKWEDIRNIIALGAECHELMHACLIAQQTSYTDNTRKTEAIHEQMPGYIELYKKLGGEEFLKAYNNGVPISDIAPGASVNV